MKLTEFREVKPRSRGFARLTPIDEARQALLAHCFPVAATAASIEAAIGLIAAETILSASPLPRTAIALRDGHAVAALDTVGASTYAPAFALSPPQWVNCGDPLPQSTDAVLPSHAIQAATMPIEILAQATPGDGARCQGSDFKAPDAIVAAGETIRPIHFAVMRASGATSIKVRSPRLKILVRHDLPQGDLIGPMLLEQAKRLGALTEIIAIDMSDVTAFTQMLATIDADLVVCVGGTGFGDEDHTAEALQHAGSLLVHGLALRPGETGGWGCLTRPLGAIPVILAPGRLEAALAVWLSLAQPCLCAMMAVTAKNSGETFPLARKITSNPGIADIVLLRRISIDAKILWEPLASGDLPWHALVQAETWHIVPPESEGYPAGALVCAEEI